MQAINNQLDSAYLKIEGMLALVNYMQQDFEERSKNCIDPKSSVNSILNTGYGHEVALNNANNGLTGIFEDLKEIQELISKANSAILQAGKGTKEASA